MVVRKHWIRSAIWSENISRVTKRVQIKDSVEQLAESSAVRIGLSTQFGWSVSQFASPLLNLSRGFAYLQRSSGLRKFAHRPCDRQKLGFNLSLGLLVNQFEMFNSSQS
jgi:hypothetical protein